MAVVDSGRTIVHGAALGNCNLLNESRHLGPSHSDSVCLLNKYMYQRHKCKCLLNFFPAVPNRMQTEYPTTVEWTVQCNMKQLSKAYICFSIACNNVCSNVCDSCKHSNESERTNRMIPFMWKK